jgi:hypothetical protein
MGAIQTQSDMYQLRQSGEAAIPNPGAGGTFDLRGRDFSTVTVTATGTYTLPSSPVGTQLLVCCDDTSVVTLADASGTFHIFTGTSGSKAVLCQATDANSWAGTRLVRNTTDFVVDSGQIGYSDSGDYTAATEVDAALTEIYTHLLNIEGWSAGAPLTTLRIVDTNGDVGTSAAPGVLASNTAPILRGEATTEALAVHWVANGVEIVATTIDLPPDLDGDADMYVDLVVVSNNTNNAPSFSVLHNFNGGAQVTDTATGTSISTVQTITATIAANEVPASASVLGFQLLPGAHASDTWTLFGVRVRGKRTLLTEA